MSVYNFKVSTKAKNTQTGEVREAVKEINVAYRNGEATVLNERITPKKRKRWVEVQ